MGIRSLLDLIAETLAGSKVSYPDLARDYAISVFVGWRWRGSVDHSEISRIQAEDNALKERLHLAQDKQEDLTEQIERLKPYTAPDLSLKLPS
jgi:hypothetical protein